MRLQHRFGFMAIWLCLAIITIAFPLRVLGEEHDTLAPLEAELDFLLNLREQNNGADITPGECLRLGYLRMELRGESAEALDDADLALSKDLTFTEAFLLKARAYTAMDQYQYATQNYNLYYQYVPGMAPRRLAGTAPPLAPFNVVMEDITTAERHQDGERVYTLSNSLITQHGATDSLVYLFRARGGKQGFHKWGRSGFRLSNRHRKPKNPTCGAR